MSMPRRARALSASISLASFAAAVALSSSCGEGATDRPSDCTATEYFDEGPRRCIPCPSLQVPACRGTEGLAVDDRTGGETRTGIDECPVFVCVDCATSGRVVDPRTSLCSDAPLEDMSASDMDPVDMELDMGRDMERDMELDMERDMRAGEDMSDADMDPGDMSSEDMERFDEDMSAPDMDSVDMELDMELDMERDMRAGEDMSDADMDPGDMSSEDMDEDME
ncbi:MAG: hypothetical protein AAGI01_08405 [Myxococcota bacterium]